MTRTPLRPLARILAARSKGENPDAIEAENLRLRAETVRDRARGRAEGRLLFLGLAFFMAFMAIGARMSLLAASVPMEPRAAGPGAAISAARADITDRRGRILATNLSTYALYAHPRQMVDPVRVAAPHRRRRSPSRIPPPPDLTRRSRAALAGTRPWPRPDARGEPGRRSAGAPGQAST